MKKLFHRDVGTEGTEKKRESHWFREWECPEWPASVRLVLFLVVLAKKVFGNNVSLGISFDTLNHVAFSKCLDLQSVKPLNQLINK